MTGKKKALFRFLLLFLWALALQGLPFLYIVLMEGDQGAALYWLHLYGLVPLSAALVPFWAGLGGVHPMAAFFPIGGALLLFPVYHSPGVGLICLVLSLIGSAAGQELKKRREEANNPPARHGTGKYAKQGGNRGTKTKKK